MQTGETTDVVTGSTFAIAAIEASTQSFVPLLLASGPPKLCSLSELILSESRLLVFSQKIRMVCCPGFETPKPLFKCQRTNQERGRGGEPIPHLSLIKTQNNDLGGRTPFLNSSFSTIRKNKKSPLFRQLP